MTSDETRDFALCLMHEVWEPFDDQAVPRFYHEDVAGHHRAQKICLDDIAARLRWDRLNFKDPVYDIRDIIADEDKFAIRFIYACTLVQTGAKFVTEVTYFYRIRDGKISEFWLLSDADFDYKQRP